MSEIDDAFADPATGQTPSSCNEGVEGVRFWMVQSIQFLMMKLEGSPGW